MIWLSVSHASPNVYSVTCFHGCGFCVPRSAGARECKTLQSISSRREDAGRNRRHPDGIGAIKLEAVPRYQQNWVTPRTDCGADFPNHPRSQLETTVETQPARYVRDGQPTGKGVRAHAQTPFCDFGNRRSAQRLVTGRLPASAVAAGLHFGCPQPLTLTPSCWPA